MQSNQLQSTTLYEPDSGLASLEPLTNAIEFVGDSIQALAITYSELPMEHANSAQHLLQHLVSLVRFAANDAAIEQRQQVEQLSLFNQLEQSLKKATANETVLSGEDAKQMLNQLSVIRHEKIGDETVRSSNQ